MNRPAAATLIFAILLCPLTASRVSGQEPASRALLSLDSLLNIPVEAAAKYQQTQRSAPASTVVVTHDEIRRFGYATLGEVLADVPGFYGSYDRNYFYLGVRGFSRPSDYNNRILLLLDGHPLNENIYDSAFLGTAFGMDLDNVDRVEVIRGPGAALYGGNAVFAVVNVIPRDGAALDGARLNGSVGSFGTRGGTATFGTVSEGGVDIVVSGSAVRSEGQDHYYAEFDDPEIGDGVARDLDADELFSGYGRVAWRGLSLNGFLTSRRKDIPTAPYETLFNQEAWSVDERAFVEARVERRLGPPVHLSARAFLDTYRFEARFPYDGEDGGKYSEESHGMWLGAEARMLWDLAAWNRLTLGGELRRHTTAEHASWSEEGDFFAGDFPFNMMSGYLQDEVQALDNLAFTVGIRVDGYSTFGRSITPRAAVVYHPTDAASIKLLYGSAFRPPNVYESRYQEEDFWERNPDLRPEEVRTLELAWEQRIAAGLFGTVSLYDYRADDLIDQVFDEEDIGSFANLGAVDARGFEAALTARLENGAVASLGYTWQHARDVADGGELTNSPEHLVRGRIGVPLGSWLFGAATVSYEDRRLTVYETVTDAHILANLTVTARAFGDRLEATVTARNILDRAYSTPGGWEHTQTSLAQNGRSFRVKVGVLF